MTIYDYTVSRRDGSDFSLGELKGKVILIVNTATGCGFTPQYEGLQQLYEKYNNRGFEILDFPCNQFGNQAPGTETEIENFCILNYKTTFPRFAKVEVNGKNEEPLFRYLKDNTKGILGNSIKWNFTKFLVSADGKRIKRYAPTVKPARMERDIEEMLMVEAI